MDKSMISKLGKLLGENRLMELAYVHNDGAPMTNKMVVICDCDINILGRNRGRLILPSDSMLEIEKELENFQRDGDLYKRIIRGCYWLVDDLFKFEHIGVTRDHSTTKIAGQSEVLKGLRFLSCAACDRCPLGWYDPNTKEAYLHVWTNED